MRAEKNGVKIFFTNKLFIKHLHLDNDIKTYSKHRYILNKPTEEQKILTYVISQESILRSSDITFNNIQVFSKVENNTKLFLYKNSSLYINLYSLEINLKIKHGVFKKTIKNLYRFLKYIINIILYPLNIISLRFIKKHYPEVMSIKDTINDIKLNNKSISRFGDGELQLILGIGLGSPDHNNEYQIFDESLKKRLVEILENGQTNKFCIAILPFSLKYDDTYPFECYSFSYWEKFLIRYFKKYSFLLKDKKYGNALISRQQCFYENELETIKSLWDSKKVLFVTGEKSHFIYDNILFGRL